VGVAICSRDFMSATVAGLLERADGALYQAKQGGRNGYRLEAAMQSDELPDGQLNGQVAPRQGSPALA
jgi:predicted signal transduction protein with EAL and GGDEF domain